MEILVLQGPNLNMIGTRSSQVGQKITLDKINRSLRKAARDKEVELKILQTHRIDKAITFIHRNRNSANGIIIAPMAWGRFELSLLEAIELVNLPMVQVLFSGDFGFGPTTPESIYTITATDTVEGPPDTAFLAALDILVNYK